MIFEVNSKKDRFIENVYNKGMKKFNNFFNLKVPYGKLSIFIVNNRKDIDLLRNQKTESWVIGWSWDKSIFLLNRKNYEKESSHKYSDKEYSQLILHEMVHFFHDNLVERSSRHAAWLNEGIAIFLSGQNTVKKKPVKFKEFLSFYSSYGKGIYLESGFFIEFLFKNFGKAKLIRLLKETAKCRKKKEFYNQFKKIYGFDLNYNEINKRYKK
jgi:hypothetical protein